MEGRPVGKLVFDHIEYNQAGCHAIYATIYFLDEAGTLWKMYASSFLCDLI